MIMFLVGCVLLLVLWVVHLYRSLALAKSNLKMQDEKHRQEYADFIAKVNHQGPVPIGSTVVGLIKLVSLGLMRCISSLADLRARKDWNTLSVTQEISEISSQELVMLENQFTKFLASIRKVLEDHNHKQE